MAACSRAAMPDGIEAGRRRDRVRIQPLDERIRREEVVPQLRADEWAQLDQLIRREQILLLEP